MTTQDLKNNESEIIATITEKVGENNVPEVMEIMVDGLDCCDDIEELLQSALSIFQQRKTKSNRKVSKLATLIGKINEIEEN